MAEQQTSKNIDTNVVIVTGNLGKAPEMYESGDKRYYRMRLAVTCRGADRPTAWLDLTDWSEQRQQNIGQYLTPGRQIAVTASVRTYKQPVVIDGKEVNIDRVGFNVQEIQLLQRPASETNGNGNGSGDVAPESPVAEAIAADDTPF